LRRRRSLARRRRPRRPAPASQTKSEQHSSHWGLRGLSIGSAHDASIAAVDVEINRLKAAQEDLKKRMAASDPKSSAANDERTKLRAEMNALKDSQAANKTSRGATLEDLKRLQAKVQDKVRRSFRLLLRLLTPRNRSRT
jgi:chromosome segregation ATPase